MKNRKINLNIVTWIVTILVLGILCTRCIKVPDIETPVTLSISNESLTFTANGQQQTFSVTSNANCSATSDASWITISPSSFGSEKGLAFKSNEVVTMTVTATSNTSVTPRTATITINSSIPGVTEQTINVTQAAVTPNLVISLSSLNFAATSDEGQTFSITSNIDWTVSSDATWLNINPESGSNNGTVTVIANANTGDARTAIITVSGTGVTARTISVTQAQVTTNPELSVSTSSLTFSASAEQQRFTITSNTNWTITSNQPWCTIQPTSGNENREIAVSVTENTATTSRTAILTITAGNQSRQVNIIQIARNEVTVPDLVTATFELESLFDGWDGSLSGRINATLYNNSLEPVYVRYFRILNNRNVVNTSVLIAETLNPTQNYAVQSVSFWNVIQPRAEFTFVYEGQEYKKSMLIEQIPFIYVESIEFNKNTLSLTVSDSEKLIPTVFPADATNKNVGWSISDYNVASISADGTITARSTGTATITATAVDGSNISGICTVTVNPFFNSVTGVSLSPDSPTFTMYTGATQQLTAIIVPANGTNKTVTWSSTNMNVATVTNNGLVTAIGPGTATIFVTTVDGDYRASCTVTVTATNVPVTSVSLNTNTLSLNVGNTGTLTATVSPSDATNQNVIWTSSNPFVTTVSPNGIVTALSAGTATITVTTQDGNRTASCAVTVVQNTQGSSEFGDKIIPSESFGGGNGSQGFPYLINNAQQLKKLVDDVNKGINYANTYFILMTDILVTANEWIPIGNHVNSSSAFRGNFDGNSHIINGTLKSDKYRYFGFFGTLESNAQISNLTIAATVKNEMNEEYTAQSTGAIAGSGAWDENVKINNCHVFGTITTVSSWTGGILGSGTAIIQNCSVSNNITGGMATGGITGSNRGGEIKNCTVFASATITGGGSTASYTGGIVGLINNSTSGGITPKPALISDCTNNATIIGGNTDHSNTGGIIGSNSGQIINCSNAGKVIGNGKSSHIGGIAGSNEPGAVIIINCTNQATVTGGSSSEWSSTTGGIVGISGDGQIHTSLNTGNISGVTIFTGGLLGRNNSISVKVYSCCTNLGTVNGQAANANNQIGEGKAVVPCPDGHTKR